MGDSGALALGFILATMAVEGVLKTAATIALVGPLLVMAVPILDTSFVVLKRLKYRRPPWGADHNHFYHRFMRIGFSQRRTAAYLHLWAILLARPTRSWSASCRRGPQGVWDIGQRAARLRGRRARRGRLRLDGLHARDPQGAAPARPSGLGRLRQGRAEDGSAPGDRGASVRTPSSGRSWRPALRASSAGGNAPSAQARRRPGRRLTRPATASRPGRLGAADCARRPAGSRRHLAAAPRARASRRPPPIRPSKIDHTGVPSTAASRFIVPPADTSTSAKATRLRPSTARSGTTTRSSPSERHGRALLRRCGRARRSASRRLRQAPQQRRQQRVLRAAAGRARRTARVRTTQSGSLALRRRAAASTDAVRLEVGQVVLLLQAREADELGRPRPVARAGARPGSRRARAPGWPAGR